jgi:hypothetical protein
MWYSLPLRQSLPDFNEVFDLASILSLERTRHVIIKHERRLYIIYNRIDRSSATLYHSSPLDGDPVDAFSECFSHSERLQLKEDPFGLQLLHITHAIDQWRMVLIHVSMEISLLVCPKE